MNTRREFVFAMGLLLAFCSWAEAQQTQQQNSQPIIEHPVTNQPVYRLPGSQPADGSKRRAQSTTQRWSQGQLQQGQSNRTQNGMISRQADLLSPTQGGGVTLNVQVTDVVAQQGEIIIALHSKEASFPDKLKQADYLARIAPGNPTHTFKNIKPRNYAVVVVHDLNSNKFIDKSFIGMPKEPIGLSNFKAIGFNNRPTFKKALVAVTRSGTVSVKLNSLGATASPSRHAGNGTQRGFRQRLPGTTQPQAPSSQGNQFQQYQQNQPASNRHPAGDRSELMPNESWQLSRHAGSSGTPVIF